MAEEKKTESAVERFKKWGKWVFFAGLALMGIAMIAPKNAESDGVDSGRKYAAHYNWSKDQRDFFMKEVAIPDGRNGWVSIATPPGYRMETSRTFDVEYDFGGGATIKEGPSMPRVEAGPVSATFDVRATGSGGNLKIWLHRNPPVIVEKKSSPEQERKVE